MAEATFGYLFTSDNKRESFLITWPLRVRRETACKKGRGEGGGECALLFEGAFFKFLNEPL